MVQRLIRITVETDTLLVVHRAMALSTWCPSCGAQVDAITLTPDSFSEPAAVTQMQQWLAAGKLHLWHTTDGTVQVCVTSLLQCSA